MDATMVLNRFFSRSTFENLIDKGTDKTYYAVIRRYIDHPESKNNQELISEVYGLLKANHRNEYFYKNTLLNTLLLKVHRPTTTTALSEIPVGRSKADFVLINGKAVVYEIKTELDNLDRLPSQLDDYYKAFSYVSIVTHESNYEMLLSELSNPNVGIYVINEKGSISRKSRREPTEYSEKLDPVVMFKLLRKPEYEAILYKAFGSLPDVSQFAYYEMCKKLFCSLDVQVAKKLVDACLKQRACIDIQLYEEIPYELKYTAYFSKMKSGDYLKLSKFLNNSFGG